MGRDKSWERREKEKPPGNHPPVVDAPPRVAASLQSMERGACSSGNRTREGTTSPANQPQGSSVRLANSSRTDVFLVVSWRTI